MNLLYVGPDGQVHSGRLLTDPAASGDAAPTLVTRTGQLLGPTDVLTLLAPHRLTEDQRATLWRAIRAGYRVEDG